MKSPRHKNWILWIVALATLVGIVYAWMDIGFRKSAYIEATETYNGVVKYEIVDQNSALAAVKDEHNPFTHLNDLNYFGDIKIMPRVGSVKDLDDTTLREMAKYLQTDFISLRRTSITNHGLKYLQFIKDLSIIDLSGTRISDEGMTYLPAIKKLQGLNLLETSISRKGIRHLRACEGLNWLALSSFALQNGGLEELTHMPALTGLLLEAQDMDDQQFQLIATLGQLVSLHLAKSNRLTNTGLSHISRMPNLRHLYIGPGKYNNQGLFTISHMQKLETLFVEAGANVDDEALEHIAGMRNLVNAYVTGPGISTVYDITTSPR